MQRESFRSRLGFLLVSAGCAIGIGNVWRFPYVVGENGGGIFVLLYLFFLLILGVPVLTMELAIGRSSRQSVLKGYKALEKPGAFWHLHGYACILGNYMLMMFYTTVSGWMLGYLIRFIFGSFQQGMDSVAVEQAFGSLLASPVEMTLLMSVVVIAGFCVCSIGLQNGLERISKIMMSSLLVLILALAVHSFLLPGAKSGLSFYLIPNLEAMKAIGVSEVISAAMNQAFFTLSLGIAAMEIFGTYMSRDVTLASESIRISLLDTFVAITSGLIIFPACFTYGVAPNAGPRLIFVTLPNVFVNMSGGRFWGVLFFLFMTFASFSTVIAVFENLMSFFRDSFGWERKKTAMLNCVIVLVCSMPCVLGFNLWSDLHLIGGRDVLDSEDFIVSNLLLPIGSMVFLLFCVTKWGWGFDKYLEEANAGQGIKLPRWLKPYFQFVLPVLVLVIIIQSLL